YPWTNIKIDGWLQLKRWLFLPDYTNPPLATQLIADFFQLLFACQQWRVFKYETNEKDHIYIQAGESNREIIYDNDVYKDNPTRDFVTKRRNWFDQIKYVIFMYSAWCVLSIVYLAGTTRISLLGLGYLIACFYFFWYGQDFLTKHVTVMVRIWTYLIYYCFAVIFIKACLQIVACIDILSIGCVIQQIFSVACITSDSSRIPEQCDRSAAKANLFMDGFCLICLLLQKRMFGSYYWEHIVAELRSQAKLASEGAVLFNDISRKRDKEATDREKQTVEKITQSIDRIKEQHSKLNRSDSKAAALLTDSSDHFEVIRSGDYYMFDYESDEKEDEEKQDEATVAQEQILQVITARDKHTAVAAAAQKPSTSSFDESDSQEFLPTSPIQSPLSPAITTTTEMIPSSTTEQTTSVEPKESEESQKSVLFKICLIGQIVVDYSIDFFKRNSRDYREVSIQLYQMKTQDKNNQHEERTRSQMNITTVSAVNLDNADFTASVNNAPTNTETHSQTTDLDKLSRLYRFFDSLIYYIMSRSELVCYSAMVINHLTSGSILSMPLPLSIFLWAMLPSRPSRNYWITIITYTEAMIVVKYIFQFRFYPWNASEIIENNPLSPVNIIGINRRENAASAADLFLLLSLFFHRSILKQLGLWKAETDLIDQDVVRPVQQELSQSEISKVKSGYFLKTIIDVYRQPQQSSFVRDVYASLFFCDFMNMVIVILFYSQFGVSHFFKFYSYLMIQITYVTYLLSFEYLLTVNEFI
ncbi:unnamed protein product, partial [Rotaria sp. Silwood2]